jgi:hypothetical protein
VLATHWIQVEREEGLKRAVKDAQIAAGAIVFNDSDHGLTHGFWSLSLALTLCLRNSPLSDVSVVKFIGASQQHQAGGDANERRRPS